MPHAAEELRRSPAAAPQARTPAARALGAAGAAPDDPAASLVVTEPVANAVRHGRGRRIWVRMEADGSRLLVEVENRWAEVPLGAGDGEGQEATDRACLRRPEDGEIDPCAAVAPSPTLSRGHARGGGDGNE